MGGGSCLHQNLVKWCSAQYYRPWNGASICDCRGATWNARPMSIKIFRISWFLPAVSDWVGLAERTVFRHISQSASQYKRGNKSRKHRVQPVCRRRSPAVLNHLLTNQNSVKFHYAAVQMFFAGIPCLRKCGKSKGYTLLRAHCSSSGIGHLGEAVFWLGQALILHHSYSTNGFKSTQKRGA